MLNNRIRVLDQGTGTICTVAGNGSTCTICPFIAESGPAGSPAPNYTQFLGDGSNATSAELWFPSEVKVDKWGNLFFIDMNHNMARYICKPQSACTNAPTPSVAITADLGSLICQQPVTFTARANFVGCAPTYQWKINGANAGSNSPIFTYTPNNGDVVKCIVTPTANPYSVSCTSSTKAITSNSITMTVNAMPTAVMTITGANPLCSGGCTTIDVNGTPNAAFYYTDPIAMVSHLAHLDASGHFSVTVCPPANTTSADINYPFTLDQVTDPINGCIKYIGTTSVITVHPYPVASISGTLTLCSGQVGCIDVTGTPGATVSYPSGSIVLDAYGNGCISISATTTLGFSYIFSLTGVTYAGCSGSVSGTEGITIVPLPTAAISVSPSLLCGGGCATLNFTGTPNAIVTYYDPVAAAYTSVTLSSSGSAGVSVCPPVPSSGYATYTYSLDHAVLPPAGCTQSLTSSATVTVVQGNINASISGSLILCSGGSGGYLTISGTPGATVTYLDNGISHSVVLSSGGSATIHTIPPITYVPLSYSVSLVSISFLGCPGTVSGSASVTVNPMPMATMSIHPDTVCMDSCYTITFTGPASAYVYYYDPIAATTHYVTLDPTGHFYVTICPPYPGHPPISYVYNLTAVYDNITGCRNDTITGKDTIVIVHCDSLGHHRGAGHHSTGIENTRMSNGISVYPNPNTGSFTVELPADAGASEIEVLDILGKVIEKRIVDNSNGRNKLVQFDLSNKAKGTYLIRVKTKDDLYRDKIVIE